MRIFACVTTQLTDGTGVRLREIRADDKALLAAGHARLSERSRLKRFLGPKPKLTASDLRYLTEVDGVNHYAVVALLEGHIVGVARWVRLHDDPTTAEAAVVVGDHLQGKGLGKALARNLADAARARGVRRITASILSDNPPAEALMRVIAARLTDGGHRAGVHEMTAELAA
jgi:RimJ/RimL family protein N-acetyltransferase